MFQSHERAARGSLQKFIIGYGRHSQTDVIDAVDSASARAEAARRSKADDLDDPDIADDTWAEPYSDLMARDLGLTDGRRAAPWWS